MTANVPISDTGTAIIGMSVARQFCRKTSTTMKTRTIASNSVWKTLVDRLVDEDGRVVDDPVVDALGESLPSAPPSCVLMALAVSRALEPGSWKTASVTDGSPSR